MNQSLTCFFSLSAIPKFKMPGGNGTKCCVKSCFPRRKPQSVQTFEVPQQPGSLRNQWLINIGCDDKPKLRVCSRHFSQSDFLPDELNLTKKHKKRAKKNLRVYAVPTLHLDNGVMPNKNFGQKIIEHDHLYNRKLGEHEEAPPPKVPRLDLSPDIPCDCSDEKLKEQQGKIEELQKEVNELKACLSKVFNEDQVKFLNNQNVRSWSDKTLEECIYLYYKMGGTAYEAMRKRGFPIPSKRTLTRHLSKIQCTPGTTLKDYLRLLHMLTKDMEEKNKKVGVIGDEIAVDPKVEFDVSTQEFIGAPTIPASKKMLEKRTRLGISPDKALAHKAFNLLVTTLRLNFKLLISFQYTDSSFDPEAVAKWMREVFTDLQSIGLDVVFFTSDMSSQMVSV